MTASSNITDQEQDDNGEQRDKSESEQDMRENSDVPGNNETKDNKHVSEDQKQNERLDSYLKHAPKENHSSIIKEQDLNKQCSTECNNTVNREGGEVGSVLSALKEEQNNICQLEPHEDQ